MEASGLAAFSGPIAYGVAIFLGVVAGSVVNLVTQWALARRAEKNEVANLRFECQTNIRKIDRWLGELELLRNAVNGETLDTYFGWFDFDRFLVPTANRMLQNGALYRHLTHDEIEALQVISAELSTVGAKRINDQIAESKAAFDKARAVRDVDFWERKLKGHRKSLEAMSGRLKSTKRLTKGS